MSLISKISSIIVISLLLCGLGYYIRECYIKYKITPEVLVNEKYIQRDEVPFPAVTVCPPSVARKEFIDVSKFKDNLAQNKTPNQEELAVVASLGQACTEYFETIDTASEIENINENVIENIVNSSPFADETFGKCRSEMETVETVKCKDFFSRSFTNFGICFTYNMLDHQSIFSDDISTDFDIYKQKNVQNTATKWSLEKRYLTDEEFVKPLKSTEVKSVLLIASINKSEESNFCYNFVNAFMVIFHLPNEIPTGEHTFHAFHFDKHKYMRITASVSSVDKSLMNFPLDERKCYFEDEKQLRFFKSYTMSNCIQECMANFTLKECGCVPFYAPRSNDMKVCKFKDIPCRDRIYDDWPPSYYKDPENLRNCKIFPCGCMRTCSKIKYSILSESIYDKRILERKGFLSGSIKIDFSSDQISEITNYVTYRFQNFISDVGGLAGLFLGFSLLTVYQMMLSFARRLRNKFPESARKLKNRWNRAFNRIRMLHQTFRQGHARNRAVVFVLPYHHK